MVNIGDSHSPARGSIPRIRGHSFCPLFASHVVAVLCSVGFWERQPALEQYLAALVCVYDQIAANTFPRQAVMGCRVAERPCGR